MSHVSGTPRQPMIWGCSPSPQTGSGPGSVDSVARVLRSKRHQNFTTASASPVEPLPATRIPDSIAHDLTQGHKKHRLSISADAASGSHAPSVACATPDAASHLKIEGEVPSPLGPTVPPTTPDLDVASASLPPKPSPLSLSLSADAAPIPASLMAPRALQAREFRPFFSPSPRVPEGVALSLAIQTSASVRIDLQVLPPPSPLALGPSYNTRISASSSSSLTVPSFSTSTDVQAASDLGVTLTPAFSLSSGALSRGFNIPLDHSHHSHTPSPCFSTSTTMPPHSSPSVCSLASLLASSRINGISDHIKEPFDHSSSLPSAKPSEPGAESMKFTPSPALTEPSFHPFDSQAVFSSKKEGSEKEEIMKPENKEFNMHITAKTELPSFFSQTPGSGFRALPPKVPAKVPTTSASIAQGLLFQSTPPPAVAPKPKPDGAPSDPPKPVATSSTSSHPMPSPPHLTRGTYYAESRTIFLTGSQIHEREKAMQEREKIAHKEFNMHITAKTELPSFFSQTPGSGFRALPPKVPAKVPTTSASIAQGLLFQSAPPSAVASKPTPDDAPSDPPKPVATSSTSSHPMPSPPPLTRGTYYAESRTISLTGSRIHGREKAMQEREKIAHAVAPLLVSFYKKWAGFTIDNVTTLLRVRMRNYLDTGKAIGSLDEATATVRALQEIQVIHPAIVERHHANLVSYLRYCGYAVTKTSGKTIEEIQPLKTKP